jgi:hypothetical protein
VIPRGLQGLNRKTITLLVLLSLVAPVSAQIGWSVSDTVRVSQTDFPITGPAPYPCQSLAERTRLQHDPVYKFQVWASRKLEKHLGWVERLQTTISCEHVCAVRGSGRG